MTPFATLFLLITGTALFLLPRRWAPLALLLGSCYMPLAQGLDIGPFSFQVIRILIAIGLVRVILKGEWVGRNRDRMDAVFGIWLVWILMSSVFHDNPKNAFVFRMGTVLNCGGIYFLTRCFVRTIDDVKRLGIMLSIVLIPIALAMVIEQITIKNLFSSLGAPDAPGIRKGRIRSQGPFSHAILAGTVGAVCVPIVIGAWRSGKITKLGLLGCLVMVVVSSSSGPLMSLMTAIGGLIMWRFRHMVRSLQIGFVIIYFLLSVVMTQPAYFIIARIDLTGGSTGWHRAQLIQTTMKHFNEWWIGGTDYTRHWMATGVPWSKDHIDITNYYIQMAVLGGLPMMGLFFYIVWRAFSYVGSGVRLAKKEDNFTIWCLGVALISLFTSGVGVAFFDQSLAFVYLTIGAIVSARAHIIKNQGAREYESQPVVESPQRVEPRYNGYLYS